MTKIAIISQAEQGVLIDISGCSSLSEAKQYLTSTLQVSSQFWEGLIVDLNLGPLVLTPEQVNEIQAIVSEVGVQPRQIFSLSPITRASLMQCRLPLGMLAQLQGYTSMKPAELPLSKQEVAIQQSTLTQSSMPSVEAYYNAATPGIGSTTTLAVDAPHWEEHGAGLLATPEYRAKNATEQFLDALKGPAHASSPTATAQGYSIPSFDGAAAEDFETLPTFALGNHDVYSSATPANQIEQNYKPTDLSYFEQGPVSHSRLSMANHHVPAQHQQAQQQAQQQLQVQPSSKQAFAPKQVPSAVLMMKQTLRSGQRVCHKGHLVIIGDVNPGAEIVADGDITVWGALRGMAHAGANGNSNAEIRALKFEPIQLRIAQAIARSPDRSKIGGSAPSVPETARVIDGKIRLSVSDTE